MALSLLHQTVSHAGATFTPDLTVNGWFTLHWYDDTDLTINDPTALLGLANGQEFIIDIIKHPANPGTDSGKRISWGTAYRGWVTNELNVGAPYDEHGLWTGETSDLYRARRIHFLWLNGVAGAESLVMITPY
jgi:hypothetical protein